MAGQIVRRGSGNWLVRISLGRDANGKRLYHNRTIKGSKKDAERYRTKALRELDTGTFVEASQESVAGYVERWLSTSARPRVRSRTFADYQFLAARYLIPRLGTKRLAQLGPQDIQSLYAGMQERGLSARTIRYAHSVLHGALEQAVKWRLLAQNPAKLVNLPRQDRKEVRALSPDEASRFVIAASEDRFHALWVLLLTSGLRPGEAVGLRWSDIEGDTVRIQRTLVRASNHEWQLAEPKTPRARRVITLPTSTVRILQEHRKRQIADRLKAGEAWEEFDLAFCTAAGQPLDYRVVIRRHFKSVVAAAGLAPIRPYDLRHSCATLLLAAGENVKVASERLGHSSAVLTLDVYSHVLPHMQQQAATTLETLLFQKTNLHA